MRFLQDVYCFIGFHEWEERCELNIHDGGMSWNLNLIPTVKECKFCHKTERLVEMDESEVADMEEAQDV